jgi:hypothetical protein
LDVLALMEEDRADTLVLDIEGSEVEVVERAANAVRKIVMEVHPSLVGHHRVADMAWSLRFAGLQVKALVNLAHPLGNYLVWWER